LPPGLLIASKFGHVGEVVAKLGVPGFELRQEFVANAITGKGEVTVRGVLAPWLVAGMEEFFNFSSRGVEKRPENRAFRKVENGVNAGEAFGPCAAEEFGQHGLGLVVDSVGRGDGVEGNFAEQLAKPGVA
jgi:hypothetical protein